MPINRSPQHQVQPGSSRPGQALPAPQPAAPERATTGLAQAEAAFLKAYPAYERTRLLDELRAQEYARLDDQQQIYLDYTGGGLYAERQLREHMALLQCGLFGNPHSNNPTSLATTELVEQTRSLVLDYFNAPPGEYSVVFTANASAALKLVGESYPFAAGGHYLLTADNHNSVNGIREFARRNGAAITYLPVTRPEMRVDLSVLPGYLERAAPGRNNLFAFPAQSNFTGVQHPWKLVELARAKGWDVLVDCAAFAPTNRLDLCQWRPDFVPLSFYKMFGYPTGAGCLLARKPALAKLRRPWFAGGTISIASVLGDGHYLLDGEAAFEDGTVNYLNLPAVAIGLRYLASIGIELIHERVLCLTGWLLAALATLRHENGEPLVRIHGPTTTQERGGTIAFNLYDPQGTMFEIERVERLANRLKLSLRTGCFCNPGAGEIAYGLTKAEMGQIFSRQTGMSFQELRHFVQQTYGKQISAIRVSVGLATNFADVYHFVRFAGSFLDKGADEMSL